MASAAETKSIPRRGWLARVETWNRRIHYYLGLYLLFFLWLFSFSGLLLNHGEWRFAEFWPNRTELTYERAIQVPLPGSDLERARRLMSQLGIAGEIEWLGGPQKAGTLAFGVNRPGTMHQVVADFASGRARVRQTRVNSWGTVVALHTFSGVRMGSPERTRDWVKTSLWTFSMDALAAGLLAMVISSYYLWFRRKEKRRLGMAAIAAGVAVCAVLVFGFSS